MSLRASYALGDEALRLCEYEIREPSISVNADCQNAMTFSILGNPILSLQFGFSINNQSHYNDH